MGYLPGDDNGRRIKGEPRRAGAAAGPETANLALPARFSSKASLAYSIEKTHVKTEVGPH
jgi:hypothetical protein